MQQALLLHGINRPLVITSGYRSVATNAATENAARNSMHCYAKAADMYVNGISTESLFATCWSRAVSGGMGYYSSHVHLDSGTRRWWVGDLSIPGIPPGSAGIPRNIYC